MIGQADPHKPNALPPRLVSIRNVSRTDRPCGRHASVVRVGRLTIKRAPDKPGLS